MVYKEGRFADILPSPAEQDEQIALHDRLYKTSLINTLQILAPEPIKEQANWPTRVYLNDSPQEVPIRLPRKSPLFYFQLLLAHYPSDKDNPLTSPQLKFVVRGTDRLYIPQEETKRRKKTGGADLRNFTTPNTDPDPASLGNVAAYRGATPFNILLESETNFSLSIYGFDGTNPEWVDIAITGRAIMNRKILESFF